MPNKKLAVNDWQDFSLKKDIEKLNKLVKRACDIGSTAIFDIVVAFLAVLFDRLFDNMASEVRITIYFIATILVIASLVKLFVGKGIRALRNKSIAVPSRDVREYIDSFDNEIWCYVMMSDSFLDLLQSDSTADSHRKTFYFTETCFWLNKSIDKLSLMSHKLTSVFDDDIDIIAQNKKVSVARLVNLLDIIFSIEKSISERKIELGISDEEACRLTTNNIYIERLKQFVMKVHSLLKVDVSRFAV